MNKTNLTSRLTGINLFAIAFILLLSPLTEASAACCSGHGGVASCNKSTGYKMCKDGSASPTCKCTIPKSTTSKTTKSKATTTAPSTTKSTTTKPKSSWWGGSSNKTTTSPAHSTTSGKGGCCSHHGGIAQCNKSTGRQMCKDGSLSATCTCH